MYFQFSLYKCLFINTIIVNQCIYVHKYMYTTQPHHTHQIQIENYLKIDFFTSFINFQIYFLLHEWVDYSHTTKLFLSKINSHSTKNSFCIRIVRVREYEIMNFFFHTTFRHKEFLYLEVIIYANTKLIVLAYSCVTFSISVVYDWNLYQVLQLPVTDYSFCLQVCACCDSSALIFLTSAASHSLR